MKPRASASFCHWPNDRSTPSGHVAPELRVEARLQARDHVVGAGPIDGSDHSGFVVETRHVAKADRLARQKLEAEEILKRARQAAAPLVRRHSRQRRVVHENAAGRRLVHLREQLDQRRLARAVLADDGHDRPRRQRQRHIVEHEPRRARIGERHVIETDAVAQPIRHRRVGRRRRATPRSPRATRDDASRPSRSRAENRSRRRWRRCTPTAAIRPPAPAGRRRRTTRVATRRRRPRRRTRRRRPPTPACATPPMSSGPRDTIRIPAFPGLPALRDQPFADAGDAHFLAGRSGGRRGEEMSRQPLRLRPALLRRTLDRGPPGGRQHRRQREDAEQHQRRVDRHQQRDRHRRAAGSSRTVAKTDMYM